MHRQWDVLLTSVDQHTLHFAVGVLLVIYATYNLARPAMKPIDSGLVFDFPIGVALIAPIR